MRRRSARCPGPGKHNEKKLRDPMTTAINVCNVVKRFGRAEHAVLALDDVSLDIADNEFFTLLGPSGCGKTTLLRIIAGFEHASSGRVEPYRG